MDRLQRGIAAAVAYIVRHQRTDGSFVYLSSVDGDPVERQGYNIIRHAGTAYALGQAIDLEYGGPDALTALERAVAYLAQRLVEVPERHNSLAIASVPAIDGAREAAAKLGAAGLGLVALSAAERHRRGAVDARTIERLADFIVSMQGHDGRFTSIHRLGDPGGAADEWESLYYPGEAVLGLLAVDELAETATYSGPAVDGLCRLARMRQDQRELPADHWALLATAQLFATHSDGLSAATRALLEVHARRLCESIVRAVPPARTHAGALTTTRRIGPTATRLEGLLAARRSIDLGPLRPLVCATIDAGTRFLLRAQISSGPCRGGLITNDDPRPDPSAESGCGVGVHGDPSAESGCGDGDAGRPDRCRQVPASGIVRIDTVQHALSAFLGSVGRASSGADPRQGPIPGRVRGAGRGPVVVEALIDGRCLVAGAGIGPSRGERPVSIHAIAEVDEPGLFKFASDLASSAQGRLLDARSITMSAGSELTLHPDHVAPAGPAARYLANLMSWPATATPVGSASAVAVPAGGCVMVDSRQSVVLHNSHRTQPSILVEVRVSHATALGPGERFELLQADIDVEPLIAEVEQQPELWKVDVGRQLHIRPHRQTESILLRTGWRHVGDDRPTAEIHPSRYHGNVHRLPALYQWLETYCSRNGLNPGRARLVALHPGGHVLPHVDRGAYYRHRDRYHLVLQGGSSTLTSGDECVRPQPGELWRFDNHILHEASNFGTTSRLHLIFDASPWNSHEGQSGVALRRFRWPA